mmetsp:Transcript_20736/g.52505  ORF Transcript_20736/g.52505 Transcript_20736/m.52505 type:complete len:252 (-) Transcript_20736:1405-2160(-)
MRVVVLDDAIADVLLPLCTGDCVAHRLAGRVDSGSFGKELIAETTILVGLSLDRHQHNVVLTLVTDHHAVAETRQFSLDVIFDGHRSNVLTTSGDDQLLDTTSDPEHTVLVHTTHITGAKVAFGIDRFHSLGDIAHVTHEQITSTVTDFTLSRLVTLFAMIDLDIDTGAGRSSRADSRLARNTESTGTGALAHAIHLVDVDTETTKVLERLTRDRRGTGEAETAAVQTEPGADRLEQHVGQEEEGRLVRGL